MRHSLAGFIGLFLLAAGAEAADQTVRNDEATRAIVFSSDSGNCLACHAMPTVPEAEQTGNIGPPLIAMSARFSDKKMLRARIWDATAKNSDTLMPPFGRHKVLTEEQIDRVVDFIYSL